MKKLHLIPIVLLLLVIWLPFVQMSTGFYKEFDDTENRELAPAPQWSGSPAGLAAQIESYVGDHFGFRPDLIRWNSFLRVMLLKASPVRSVILGEGSWLFYCSEALDDGNSLNDYMGMIPLPESELEKLKARLEDNRRRFAEKGIPYIVAIAPNKNTIYGEHLPVRIRSCRSQTRLDQFVEYMSKNSDMYIIDHRNALNRAKSSIPVFWETDSHWNTYGAYVAYREIFREISRYYPDAAPLEISGKVEVRQGERGGDLAQMLFLTDVLGEGNNTAFECVGCPDGPKFQKLVFRHDSFGDNLYPFLNRHFRKIQNIAPFAPFSFEEIFRDPPEAVLHLFTERYLTQAIHGDFFYRDGK